MPLARPAFGPDNTVTLFASPEAFFTALFGDPQHDAHVECWRGNKWLTSRAAHAAAATLRCDALVREIAEEEAHKLARVNSYSIIELRGELYRWEHGEFRSDRFAGSRVRQLRRALEIAAARNAMAEAAE
jgi:hypothetical protein